jgi:hypothetical protein
MRRKLRLEAEISASVGGFPVGFGVVISFLMTGTYRKAIALSDSIFIVN